MQCAFCKDMIDDDSFYCDICGEEIKLCQDCNKTGKGNACTSCGKKLVFAKDISPASGNPPNALDLGSSNHSGQQGNKTATVRISDHQAAGQPANRPPSLKLINKNININLSITDNSLLGREQGNYVGTFCTYKQVSGRHCHFSYNVDSGWQVTDVGSTNGTFLNKKKLPTNTPEQLKDQMSLQIANIEFYIQIR